MSRTRTLDRLFIFAFLGASLVWAAPARGYRMSSGSGSGVTCTDPSGFLHWNIRNIPFYHNTTGQGASKDTALQAALASWTNVPSAAHTPVYQGTTSAVFTFDNLNTISWGTGTGCTGSCLALTMTYFDTLGKVILETDVTFNAEYAWATNGTSHPDTHAVAAHEIGHALGIAHTEVTTSTPRPTMYESYFGTDARSLEGDDQAALQCAESRYPVPIYQGNFAARSNCRDGGGWAWDINQPNTPIWVDLYINDSYSQTVLAGDYRADLPGNGHHGFNYQLGASPFKGPIQYRVLYHGTATDVGNSPRTIYCRMNLFTTMTPVEPVSASSPGFEFGTEISSAISGYIIALKFYKAPGETGSHTGRLWSSTGQLLGSVSFVNETYSGWQSAQLSSPVFIQAGQRYRISYTANTYKSRTPCGLSSPVTEYPLTAHASYTSPVGGTFPNTPNCNNFFVDVRFDQ